MARQLAILDLLRQTGVTNEQVAKALAEAKTRVGNVPTFAFLKIQNPLTLRGLAELLESIR